MGTADRDGGATQGTAPETSPGGATGPLSPTELERINAYWRAANYLSVGQIYLLDNPLLREPLGPEHVKPRLLGHWGTTPGLNFIYAHLNRVIRQLGPRRDLRHRPRARRPGDRRQRLPRGHLHRGLPEHHPRRRRDARAVPPVLLPGRHPQPRRARDAGLDPRGRRARLRPLARLRRGLRQPGPRGLLRRRRRRGRDRAARHELALQQVPQPGHATAPSCRSSTSTATRSPTRRSWRGSREEELRAAHGGLRPQALLRRGRRPGARAPADGRGPRRRRSTRSPPSSGRRARSGVTERPRWPMIVLRTPKGWTGPKAVDGKPVEGTWRSHQVPLAEVRTNAAQPPDPRGLAAQLPARGALRRDRRPGPGARRAPAAGRPADEREPARQRRPPPARPRAARLPRLRGGRARARARRTSEATRVLGDLPARRHGPRTARTSASSARTRPPRTASAPSSR